MGPKHVLSPDFDPQLLSAAAAPLGRIPSGRDENVVHVAVVRQPLAEEARLVVRVVGVIDLVTAPALAADLGLAVANATQSRDVTEIVVDLRLVRFLSAAGLRELSTVQQRCRHAGIPLRVIADQREVTRPLSMTGLDRTLGLRPGLDVPGTAP